MRLTVRRTIVKIFIEQHTDDSLYADLLSEIRAESTTISATIGTTTAPIQPTAFGDTGIESKDDPLSNKLQQDAERLRLNAEKRAALEALHDLYEIEIPKLGETELALLADRLSALRTAALRDIPNRFDPAVKSYKAESDKWLGRLEKCKLCINTVFRQC